ncbi:hypothetical protein SAMN05443635_11724 [Roseobacter denitrificans OCh 114]|nr:hypothetical protein SAMN05443635_11724 [Roseobacter denitrificans OCh 114]
MIVASEICSGTAPLAPPSVGCDRAVTLDSTGPLKSASHEIAFAPVA